MFSHLSPKNWQTCEMISSFAPIQTLYGDSSSPFNQANGTSRFDLHAFSRLSKADKARVVEAKIKLIAGESVDDPASHECMRSRHWALGPLAEIQE